MLKRVEKLLFEIKQELVNNKNINRLLYNDGKDALKRELPDGENAEQYIVLYPVFDIENSENYSQNTVVNIEIDSGHVADLTIEGILRVNILVNTEKWVLDDNKIRPIEIMNEVIKSIDGKKFSISNVVNFEQFTQLIISKKLTGYAMLFSITDGSSEIENF